MNRFLLSLMISAVGLAAHPMGNFSVSHYTKLQPGARGVEVTYVLDLAEIPTFQLLSSWKMDRSAPAPELEAHVRGQARQWLSNVIVTVDGTRVPAKYEAASFVIADGAGNLPIMRITAHAHVNARGGKLDYEDTNFPDRAGWKEVVVSAAAGAELRKASQSSKDLSKGLTQYPPDPTVAPPQDLKAQVEWSVETPVVRQNAPVIVPIPQPHTAPAAASPAILTAQSAPPGSVTRGDYLSKFLHQRQLTPWMILLAIGAAFVLGAAHALTPGHGKSIVAAYLVGSRGTLKHAAFLGAMVTFTHTVSVFALGLVTLFLFRYIVPEKLTAALGVVSGLSIVAVGAWMLYKRVAGQNHVHVHADHGHSHAHPHSHDHAHAHDHDHTHDHDHAHYHHHHHGPGGHTHSHVPEELSWAGLAALGASGGLVPCESALVLLLGAIALGRVGLGLILLLSFSLGLALVLMIIGILVLYAKNLLPERNRSDKSPFFRWLLIASPALVMIVGLLMTGVSLGWIRPIWMIG